MKDLLRLYVMDTTVDEVSSHTGIKVLCKLYVVSIKGLIRVNYGSTKSLCDDTTPEEASTSNTSSDVLKKP
jgi:hypothetical protein